MNDLRGTSQGRDGGGVQEAAAGGDERPVVVSFGSPEPEVCDPMPNRWLPSNKVALTFDDGPDEWTNDILDVLEEYEAVATFFVLGEKILDREAEVKRAVSLNCEIGNHTFSHANLDELSNAEICHELANCSNSIYEATGQVPVVYRAPFLNDPPAAKMAGLALGMLSVDCDVVPEDWKCASHREIATRVSMGVNRGGRVVLLHDGVPSDRAGNRRATAKAVRAIVPWLLMHGFELVTVSQLLGRVDAEQNRQRATA